MNRRQPPAEFCDLPTMHPPGSVDDGSLQDWTVTTNWVGPALDGKRVAISRGATTDGASIPRIAWRVIGHPFMWPLLGPALCHDALYAAELVPDHATADWMFLQWMEQAGIAWPKRNAVWLAVRTCGGLVWGRHTPQSVLDARQYHRLIAENENPNFEKVKPTPYGAAI